VVPSALFVEVADYLRLGVQEIVAEAETTSPQSGVPGQPRSAE